jgi:hypothetical protein
MSKELKYKEFIDQNREVLQLLAQKVKSVDTVRGVETVQEMRGRKYAIKIVDEWLTEIWGITTEELPKPEEEDELFKIIE